jgi:spermidine/putrescine-binding protein
MMKLKFTVLGIGMIVAMFTACAGSDQSRMLNIYAWSEYLPQTVLDDFTEETGIKINYDTYSSNEELLAKLQAGASGYDLIIPSDYTIGILREQELLDRIDFSKVPNFKNIDPQFTDLEFDPGNQYSIPYQWGTSCLVVNTERVTQTVTNWADLWDTAFLNRVVLPDDSREVIGMVLTMLGYDRNSTDPTQLEEAKQKILELKPNIRLYDSDSPKTALATGEVWLGMTWNGEAALAHQENSAIDYIFPAEGCGIWFDNLAIPISAPNKEAAHQFIDFILQPENSIQITREFPYSNPNRAALELLKTTDPQLYDSYMSFSATNPTDEQLQNTSMITDVGEATILWDRIWTEVKGGD